MRRTGGMLALAGVVLFLGAMLTAVLLKFLIPNFGSPLRLISVGVRLIVPFALLWLFGWVAGLFNKETH